MPSVIRIFRIAAIIAAINSAWITTHAQVLNEPTQIDKDWVRNYEPFRIAGNLYYVGTYDLTCFLITTPKGHILINAGVSACAPLIRANVEALGFKFSDIKILLTNKVHFDHVGGMAEIKEQTGAKMMVDEKDAIVLEDGGFSDYIYGGRSSMFRPIHPDRILHDKDIISLGGMKITALHHPGHTKGSMSYLFSVKDEKHTYRVLIANMPSILPEADLAGMPTYPDIAKDYGYTLTALQGLEFDIWIAAHASQCDFHDKHQPGDAYNPYAYADREGYDATINEYRTAYLKRLKEDNEN